MKERKRPARHRAGHTVLELTIATAIFSVVGYALVGAVEMGHNSQHTVLQVAASGEDIREAKDTLVAEMKIAGDSTVVVTTLADGNHELEFQHPVEVGGSLSWGVFDPKYGPDPADQNKEGWQIQYTVESLQQGGETNRRLVRRILDETSEVQEQRVIIDGLLDGASATPGFSVVQVGDMWVVRITTVGACQSGGAQGVQFHVNLRN